jgi:heme A synthase
LTARLGIAHASRMRELLRQLLGRFVLLGAVGLLAVGLSGVLAAGAGMAFGKSWVAGDPPTVHYSASRCSDFLEYAPHARSCELAATDHHFVEVVDDRIAAGLLGLVVLGACVFLARRRARLFRSDRLPVAFDSTVAAVMFGASAAWLLGYGLDQQRLGYHGAGFYLSGGVVALAAAALASARFLRITTALE